MYQRKIFERYLTVAEEKQLLKAVARVADALAQRDYAWMRLLRHTGIRVVTVSGLTVHDARTALRTGYLQIRPEISKGRRGGTLFMNKGAKRALRDLLSIRRAMGYAEQPDAALVMSRNHRPMSRRSYQSRMRQWCVEAGLDVVASPHWWRHTLAKRLMSQSTADDPRGIVQRALLHSDINTSAIYTMPDREAYEEAMEEVG